MVFLPVLLFETASMNVRRLMDDIGPILMMAIVAVVVCTLVVGVTLDAISSYGLVVCLLLGAIVATTDPVAVVGIFREVGAPKRLTTLVEGEPVQRRRVHRPVLRAAGRAGRPWRTQRQRRVQ